MIKIMLDKLKEIINLDVRLDIETDNGYVRIKETASDSALSCLRVNGLPQSSVAFTLDFETKSKNKLCFKQLSCYLNPSSKYINKGCDCVIIFIYSNKLYISILDIKSKKPNIKDTKTQLNNSEIFVKYIIELIKIHYPNENTYEIIYQKSFITTKVRKSSVTPGKEKRCDIKEVCVKPRNKEACIYLRQLFYDQN